MQLDTTVSIKVISAPYFLATKLEAFKNRGNQDFLSSHDLEDIISLIDSRAEIIADVFGASSLLKEYLALEFLALIQNDQFIQALPGHVNYSDTSANRETIILERMQKIIDLGGLNTPQSIRD